MIKKVEALKKVAVALGFGSAVSEYKGETVVAVLKEIAVKMQCASSVDCIHVHDTTRVLNYIAENYGSEEKEPYDLVLTKDHATITVKRKGKRISAGSDILYNGDKLVITAVADEGYDLGVLTVNGTSITSGDTFTVNGHSVTIVATGTIQKFNLARTVTGCTVAVAKGETPVSDGENALDYGDVITITATAEEEKQMSSLKVNGEDFVGGETLTVTEDVTITATAE